MAGQDQDQFELFDGDDTKKKGRRKKKNKRNGKNDDIVDEAEKILEEFKKEIKDKMKNIEK